MNLATLKVKLTYLIILYFSLAMFLNRNSCASNIKLKYSELLWENEQKRLENQIDTNKWQIEHIGKNGRVLALKRRNNFM